VGCPSAGEPGSSITNRHDHRLVVFFMQLEQSSQEVLSDIIILAWLVVVSAAYLREVIAFIIG